MKKTNIETRYYEQEVKTIDKYVEVKIGEEEAIEVNLGSIGKKLKISNNIYEPNTLMEIIITNDGLKYYIFGDKRGEVYISRNINMLFGIKKKLGCCITKKNVCFFGIISNLKNRFTDCDNIYFNDEIVTKVIRPFNFWKFKHVGLIKISKEEVLNSLNIHNEVAIGDSKENKISLTMKRKHRGMNYYFYKKCDKDQMIIVRSTIKGSSIRITKIPMEREYLLKYRIKDSIARLVSKLFIKDVILMFEKETKKADESGYYVFQKLMTNDKYRKKVYFIIDKECKDYAKAKGSYGSNVIEKYTFRHYLYIYLSTYFISSELSNHVINPRLYLSKLNHAIRSKPLIFLQHGIMFAKPVDNPAAMGFHKGLSGLNIYKSVISSDLEATQFYKMGYNDNDLIKCGLPKFDVSYSNKNSENILFMPTYRYWEEVQAQNSETIKETTYYKAYARVIDEFIKIGLINNLRIAGHPKFMESLIESMPEYKHIIETDINQAIENARIFITDYSSASYDAHYRGSYIIYYWEEKDYLIENYQAIPPVDETNCDGVPVYSAKQLGTEVKKAIKNDYKMEAKYTKRYKKINEFSDGKNAERLISMLQDEGIL